MNYTVEELEQQSKDEVLKCIRERLKFSKKLLESIRSLDMDNWENEHKRFDMSGYESETGECTLWNMSILNEFADLGIYDYTHYLFLDFYKGTPTLYLKYFNTDENIEFDLTGYGTTEIIHEVFNWTIFTNRLTRRR